MGNFFLKKIFTPLVYVQNDQCVMGIILRYVCWGTHRSPPPLVDLSVDRPPPRPLKVFAPGWGSILEQATPLESDHRGKKRNLQSGKSYQAIFGTQTFRSHTPSPLPPF